MRFNKQELIALASQTSHNFDREGVLVFKEKQDGFFRRSEGCSVRWFRLRGNLLFYLKGPEIWYEPTGVIVLGQHQIKMQGQDENGHWPFQIVWDNGICYRLATFHETERTMWIEAIQMSPYDKIKAQIVALNERLNRIRPIVDIAAYRADNGIVADMTEIPLCQLALSCDNLLCDAYGRPPSPIAVIYVMYPNRLCVRYASTEIVQTCSNPCFSRTILFRASDSLTGDAMIRIVVYDVREIVSQTTVPIGFTSFQLNTIQEAQRLRVALSTQENKTVGFVTINGWSLEPSYTGNSPIHTNDKNSIDVPQKMPCHRRSQSLPPRLGLKLKFPSYGMLLKQNYLNGHQVTYRFHSGLGGDITVHEIMTEVKFGYTLPIELIDIYIRRERELLAELLSVGEICGQWQKKQLELVNIHVSFIKHYYHSKMCMQKEKTYFKVSSKKADASLQFIPVNLHLQRMWVHNDTLNKTGFHDVITVGAFTAHKQSTERTGGLIRLVQEVKDGSCAKGVMNSAAANKIEAEYDNVMAVKRLRDEVVVDMDKIMTSLKDNNHQNVDVHTLIAGFNSKIKVMLALWEPHVVEDTLAHIGWPKKVFNEDSEEQTIKRLTEQLSLFEMTSDYETCDPSSSSSSKETSPTVETTALSLSDPNVGPQQWLETHQHLSKEPELRFYNDYFNDNEEKTYNSLMSVCLPLKAKSADSQSLSFGTKRRVLSNEFNNSASLEQVSFRSLCGKDKRKNLEVRRESLPATSIMQLDTSEREKNLAFLNNIGKQVEASVANFNKAVAKIIDKHCEGIRNVEYDMSLIDSVRTDIEELLRWLGTAHAALRLRCEAPLWTREHAALQSRRDVCFSQALTSTTAGLLCWLCSAPSDIVVKLLSSGLGPLCGFEGLLSLHSNEKAMWGDMVVAVEDLQTVQFILHKVGHSNTSTPHVSGTRGAITVHIPISDTLFSKFKSKKYLTFTITAVFFNIGINEKATLAEALGETTPQYHSNNDNLDRLNKYYYKYCKVFPPDIGATARASSRTKPLEEVIENLRTAVQKKVPKNVEVLQLAALATRSMNGIRFTSCKSAKDRTGMSVTLEQCAILTSEYHLAEHEQKKALSIMRSEGCRRENTFKNIGVKKYAFTKKQMAALPAEYQPPAGTYGSSDT